MSTTACAYRSTHPDVIAWWTELNAARDAFNDRCRTIQESFPGFKLILSESHRGGSLLGIQGFEGEGIHKTMLPPPSDAWRLVDRRGTRLYVPYKNHRKDPQLIEMFTGATWKFPSPWPGNMPTDVWTGGHVYSPGFQEADGAVWATWGVVREYVDPADDFRSTLMMGASRDPVDHDVWEPVKLSAYYAAIGE